MTILVKYNLENMRDFKKVILNPKLLAREASKIVEKAPLDWLKFVFEQPTSQKFPEPFILAYLTFRLQNIKDMGVFPFHIGIWSCREYELGPLFNQFKVYFRSIEPKILENTLRYLLERDALRENSDFVKFVVNSLESEVIYEIFCNEFKRVNAEGRRKHHHHLLFLLKNCSLPNSVFLFLTEYFRELTDLTESEKNLLSASLSQMIKVSKEDLSHWIALAKNCFSWNPDSNKTYINFPLWGTLVAFGTVQQKEEFCEIFLDHIANQPDEQVHTFVRYLQEFNLSNPEFVQKIQERLKENLEEDLSAYKVTIPCLFIGKSVSESEALCVQYIDIYRFGMKRLKELFEFLPEPIPSAMRVYQQLRFPHGDFQKEKIIGQYLELLDPHQYEDVLFDMIEDIESRTLIEKAQKILLNL